jgi:hypothetical protein
MADNIEAIQKSIKWYLIIGGILILASGATVWLSYVELPTHSLNIIVGMILATIKATLVALIFMQDGGGHGEKFLPGKVWELLACERPVLAMLPPLYTWVMTPRLKAYSLSKS